LFVPNKVAGGVPGKKENNAGTCTNPPPPTIESTKPAKNAASPNKSISIMKFINLNQNTDNIWQARENSNSSQS
jgi:hypothetical protein